MAYGKRKLSRNQIIKSNSGDMGNCAYFLNIPRNDSLENILSGFLDILSKVGCAVPGNGITFCSEKFDDHYIVRVLRSDGLSNINVYISAENINEEIDGIKYAESVWIEDIYDCSALVLEIAREYLRAYPNDLFVCESSAFYFTKSDIDLICGKEFSEDWYYTYKK